MWKWLQNILLKRALKSGASSSGMDKLADQTLLDAVKEMQQTSKTAQKILQAKILRQESKKTLDDIQALGEDEGEDEEEDEELGIMDLVKLFNNSKGNQGVTASTDPYAETSTAPAPQSKTNLSEIVKTLTPEQKKLIKQKYGIAL